MNLRNRKLVRTIQILFGLYLVFSGAISFFPKLIESMPQPSYNEAALSFIGALFNTGYLIYLISIIFILSGLMFIFNKWSAFGAAILVPITLNILLFHVFLDFTGFFIALIPIVLNIYLLWIHWPRYRPMFGK